MIPDVCGSAVTQLQPKKTLQTDVCVCVCVHKPVCVVGVPDCESDILFVYWVKIFALLIFLNFTFEEP